MKKLLLSLMVLATLASCGKDNKVSSGAAAAAAPSTNAITIVDQTGIALGGMIDNHTSQFGTGMVYTTQGPTTLNNLAYGGVTLYYKYTKATAQTGTGSGNGYTCETKWKIFQVCSYSSSNTGTSTLTLSRNILHNSVDVNSKIAELKSIINSANPNIAIQVQGTSNLITLTDGRQFIIDTKYPLQANPIGIRDAAGVTEYLFNITSNAY